MAGWFELSKSSDGQFRFVLKAGNAETVLTSELYKTKSLCRKWHRIRSDQLLG